MEKVGSKSFEIIKPFPAYLKVRCNVVIYVLQIRNFVNKDLMQKFQASKKSTRKTEA